MVKLLVADDEVQVRELLRSALASHGYDVTTVASVAQAVAECAGHPFDLVILDLGFPGESGASLLKEIRQAQSKVPVVIYSGLVTSDMEKELRVAGANEVLSKDVGVLQLVGQIGKIVRAKNRIFEDPSRPQLRSLLIVDDESSVRHLLRDFFKTKRYQTLEAENGEQAVELVKQENPSVVLLDVMMPGMDGLTTLGRILEINPKLGVVMATGQRDDQTVRKAMELGAYGYVLKPFDLLYLELVVLSKLMIAEKRE